MREDNILPYGGGTFCPVPFNGLHSVFEMSPPLISQPVRADSFPPGESRWVVTFGRFHSTPLTPKSDLGREADSLPYRGGGKMYLFLTQKRHRAGHGRGWIRSSPKGGIKNPAAVKAAGGGMGILT